MTALADGLRATVNQFHQFGPKDRERIRDGGVRRRNRSELPTASAKKVAAGPARPAPPART
jgi:hypothetical protein